MWFFGVVTRPVDVATIYVEKPQLLTYVMAAMEIKLPKN